MKNLSFKNTVISYTDTGKGNAVVLLHGFLESKLMWQSLIPHLSKRFRVISIDLLGHGESECYGYIHSMEDQADMVYHVISELRLRKISIVGHSMGGYVALAFAELYPDLLRSLILLNSSTLPDSDERKINRDRAIEVVKKNSSAFIKMATHHLFTKEIHENFKEEISFFTEQALKTSLQGIIASLEGMKIRIDREALLHFSPYPKLVIASSNDTIIPIEEVENQVKNTDVIFEKVPGGHVSTIEQLTTISTIIFNFLRKNG